MTDQRPTFRDYQAAVSAYRARHPEQREGQAHLNVLCEFDPWRCIASDVGGTDLDPFYRDDQLPRFLAYVETCMGGEAP